MWILFFLQTSFATTVLVKAPQADPYTYQVFIENSNSTRPSELELACPDRDDLEKFVASANDNYLNGSLEKSKKNFLAVSEIKWNCDWETKEREQIMFSLFRLAQLEQQAESQKAILQSAVDFDNRYNPDTKLFPPPLVELFETLKKVDDSAIISTNKYYDTFTKILRNGQPLPSQKKTHKIPSGTARFTFLSDSHQAKTLVISARDLEKTTITSSALIDGDCKSFEFKKPLSWQNPVQLFFSPECIVDQPVNALLAESTPVRSALLAQNSIEQQLQEQRSPRKPTWIERNYFWVGAALMGAVLISAEMNNRKDTQTVITPTNSANRN